MCSVIAKIILEKTMTISYLGALVVTLCDIATGTVKRKVGQMGTNLNAKDSKTIGELLGVLQGYCLE